MPAARRRRSTTNSDLTPKQQRVLDLLTKGTAVPEIAKSLKINTSGVYLHIRNIRRKGITIPSEQLETTQQPRRARARANSGDDHMDPVARNIRKAIEDADKTMANLDGRIAEAEETVRRLTARKEETGINRQRYANALQALG